MSGLAEILLKEGFRVSGSDSKESPLTQHLTELGAQIAYPQAVRTGNRDFASKVALKSECLLIF